MAPKNTAAVVGAGLLLISTALALEPGCTLKANPPAGAECGTLGYIHNWSGLDTYFLDEPYTTVTGCADECARRGDCLSWYFGNPGNKFCELHRLNTISTDFRRNPGSFYTAWDQSCFDCAGDSTEVACPASDGKQVTIGAATFEIHCGTDFYGGDLARVDAATFTDCLTSCASTMGCIDVAYNGNNCYMKSSLTSARSDSNVWGAVLVSAAQEAAKRLSCPKDDGATYTAKSGEQYQLQCGVDYFGGDLASTWAETIEDCLEACDTTSGCLDVAYHGKYCYLKNVVTDARQNGNVWGAIKLQQNSRALSRRAELPPTKWFPAPDAEAPAPVEES